MHQPGLDITDTELGVGRRVVHGGAPRQGRIDGGALEVQDQHRDVTVGKGSRPLRATAPGWVDDADSGGSPGILRRREPKERKNRKAQAGAGSECAQGLCMCANVCVCGSGSDVSLFSCSLSVCVCVCVCLSLSMCVCS